MNGLSANEPLLSSGGSEPVYIEKTPLFVYLVKWVLKILMWGVFIAWVTIIFLFPSEFAQKLYIRWMQATSEFVFGTSGSIFLLFSGPVLIIAFLSIIYLIIFEGEHFHTNTKNKKCPRLSLWTFPVLVNGPFGVVSAAELIGIVMFSVYILWAVSIFTIQDLNSLSKSDLSFKEKSYWLLNEFGSHFRTIGIFCLAFLFLPVTRGSVLLRIIDIPFGHAIRYHVWLGHLMMVIFTLHGVCYVILWAMHGQLLKELLQWKEVGVAHLAGVISLSAGLLMWVTSFHPVRKQYFELFFYTHQLYVVFVIFFALHAGDFSLNMAAGGIFLFMLDRFLRFCQSRKTVKVISAACLPCGTIELVLSKPGNMRYNALSFIFIQVRELSWLQWHPFSVSSSPLEGRYHISVLIKVLGEWTRKLRENILRVHEGDSQKEFLIQTHSSITASVEGPYGHESPYHLMYENLILVAGGIGISPFLAILSDIFHRIKEGKTCMPRNVLVIWAVKRSQELSLMSSVDMDSLCASSSDKLYLEIQNYVTQESDPPLEEGKLLHKPMNSFPIANESSMSGLVGTGNNIWPGIYIILSTFGFLTILGLMYSWYIMPFNITSWWFEALLIMACMTASIIIFGGIVVIFWTFWERSSGYKKVVDGKEKSDTMKHDISKTNTDAGQENIVTSRNTHYGSRPDFRKIFDSISEHWGRVDIGVIVCGPPTLQSSVAKECRSQNIRRWNQTVFHFNSHSFDL